MFSIFHLRLKVQLQKKNSRRHSRRNITGTVFVLDGFPSKVKSAVSQPASLIGTSTSVDGAWYDKG